MLYPFSREFLIRSSRFSFLFFGFQNGSCKVLGKGKKSEASKLSCLIWFIVESAKSMLYNKHYLEIYTFSKVDGGVKKKNKFGEIC